MKKRFYVVVGEDAGLPLFDSIADAKERAATLAEENKGTSYHVMESYATANCDKATFKDY